MIESWAEFVQNVKEWATARNLIAGSTTQAQGLKGMSEAGELADNFAKGEDIKDDIGDCCVVSVITMLQQQVTPEQSYTQPEVDTTTIEAIANIGLEFCFAAESHFAATGVPRMAATICTNENIDFLKCLSTAWNDIKDRKGIMHNGVFIKESDPRYRELTVNG